jgi:dTDP-glucose 4,6-dehydratase
MTMKTLLITGGAGFIGSHAVDYFLEHHPEYRIINLDKLTYAGSLDNLASIQDHPQHRFVQGDICDAPLMGAIFEHYAITDVIHFAAETHVDNSIISPDQFIQTNVVGTFTLLEAARQAWKGDYDAHRFHHISTDEVYGSLGETGSFTEETPYAPNSPYSASKASSDHLVRSYHHTYGLNTVITHCSNNYGPRQHSEKLIPTIIRKALSWQPIPIYGTGNNIRDWLHVRDHCSAISCVFHHAKAGEHYNIGGNQELRNNDIVQHICALLNQIQPRPDGQDYQSLIRYVTDRAGHDYRYAVTTDKIKTDLGWKPRTALAQGLLDTVKYFKNLIV